MLGPAPGLGIDLEPRNREGNEGGAKRRKQEKTCWYPRARALTGTRDTASTAPRGRGAGFGDTVDLGLRSEVPSSCWMSLECATRGRAGGQAPWER